MKVIIDTSAWSEYLRRTAQPPSLSADLVETLIRRDEVQMLGIIRQELLSGIRNEEHFIRVRRALSGFRDELATSGDHIEAARFFNLCRREDVQGSSVDFLICATAVRLRAPILSLDQDFFIYAQHLPIRLVRAPSN